MNWLLVVIIAGVPVKTDQTFETLSLCLAKESEMRQKWVEVINKTIQWSEANIKNESDRKRNIDFVMAQSTHGTCIPTKQVSAIGVDAQGERCRKGQHIEQLLGKSNI